MFELVSFVFENFKILENSFRNARIALIPNKSELFASFEVYLKSREQLTSWDLISNILEKKNMKTFWTQKFKNTVDFDLFHVKFIQS